MRKRILIFLILVLCLLMGLTMYQKRDELKTSEEYYREAQTMLDAILADQRPLTSSEADAVEALNGKALARDSANVQAWYQKIRLGLTTGRINDAVAGAEGLLAPEPDNYSFHSLRCMIREYAHLASPGESMACFATSVLLCERAPDNPLKRYDYVLLLRLANDPSLQQALEVYLDTVPGAAEQDFIREVTELPRAELITFILGPLLR